MISVITRASQCLRHLQTGHFEADNIADGTPGFGRTQGIVEPVGGCVEGFGLDPQAGVSQGAGLKLGTGHQSPTDAQPLDVLVNNAGIGGPTGPLETMEPADWLRTLQVNLFSDFLC